MGLPSLDVFTSATRHKMWRGDEMGSADAQVVGTGHAALDAELPGGGWPIGAMTELLQSRPDSYSWQLLLPALGRAVQGGTGPVAVIGAPHDPFTPALAAGGLPPESLLWIRSEPAAARLWACEQALRCADVPAVLAWLPQVRVDELRRLQLAAAQHDSLLFVFRPARAATSTSPARLRLQLMTNRDDSSQMDIHILKRRGPTIDTPVQVPAHSERMAAMLEASRARASRRTTAGQHSTVEDQFEDGTVVHLDFDQERRLASDRAAIHA